MINPVFFLFYVVRFSAHMPLIGLCEAILGVESVGIGGHQKSPQVGIPPIRRSLVHQFLAHALSPELRIHDHIAQIKRRDKIRHHPNKANLPDRLRELGAEADGVCNSRFHLLHGAVLCPVGLIQKLQYPLFLKQGLI